MLGAGNFFIKISLRVLDTCTYFSLYVERVLSELTQVRNLSWHADPVLFPSFSDEILVLFLFISHNVSSENCDTDQDTYCSNWTTQSPVTN